MFASLIRREPSQFPHGNARDYTIRNKVLLISDSCDFLLFGDAHFKNIFPKHVRLTNSHMISF
uniref:Uncharacterized protein n=1 Tax=Anguilla anguilla TaxID=7936 RepID=A0A0E9W9Z3_ANGAN